MNLVLTGSLGNISKPLAIRLIADGHKVTIISSNVGNTDAIRSIGATAAIGTVEDVNFLTQAFKGADAVYTMVPPNFQTSDWKGWIGSIGENYAAAIQASGVKNVVNLSSIGADQPEGVGPVSGIHRVETAFSKLVGVNITHLRPAYFFLNLLNNVPLIKSMDIMGSNFGAPGFRLPIVAISDIVDAAYIAIVNPQPGVHVKFVVSDEPLTSDIAAVLGKSINKPNLPWVEFTDEQALQGMLGAGLPEENAVNYVEMGQALRTGKMTQAYHESQQGATGKQKLADFAVEFASVYNAA
jgi:uncharacterized protein YbjT (DUF2867 family)